MSFFRWPKARSIKNQGRKFQDPNRHVKRAVVFFRVMLGVFLLTISYQQIVNPVSYENWLSVLSDRGHISPDLQKIAGAFRWILQEYPVIFSQCWLLGTCLVGLAYIFGWKVRTASLLLVLASLGMSLLGILQVNPGDTGLWNTGLLLFLAATFLQWSRAGMIVGLDAWEANRWRWPYKMKKRRLSNTIPKLSAATAQNDFEENFQENDEDLDDEDLDNDEGDFSDMDSSPSRKKVKTLAAHRHSRMKWDDEE